MRRIATFWKYLNLEQELLLLSLISTRYMSEDLIAVFEGCDFVNFGVFDYLFNSLPAEYQGEASYNVLDEFPQYYPYIFSYPLCPPL